MQLDELLWYIAWRNEQWDKEAAALQGKRRLQDD